MIASHLMFLTTGIQTFHVVRQNVLIEFSRSFPKKKNVVYIYAAFVIPAETPK